MREHESHLTRPCAPILRSNAASSDTGSRDGRSPVSSSPSLDGCIMAAADASLFMMSGIKPGSEQLLFALSRLSRDADRNDTHRAMGPRRAR